MNTTGYRLDIINAECRARLAAGDLGPFDACITDPPYEIGFMSKAWDKAGVAYDPATWAAILAALKPGAHLLAFAAPRTEHRIACAIEDAGFQIRDKLIWLYGQGFPKSLNIGKEIDKAAGAEREVVGIKTKTESHTKPYAGEARDRVPWGEAVMSVTAPATDAARLWAGWGTGLKPAYEPIILARKPPDGTIVANILAHGTGGLNVKGCAVGTEAMPEVYQGQATIGTFVRTARNLATPTPERVGRWPANVCLDEDAAAMLDEQAGERPTSSGALARNVSIGYGGSGSSAPGFGFGDSGGPSRFFYTAKASPSERNDGTDGNYHPTVKPIALMRWLIRLICPRGGIILDPFLGSGTTLIAARDEFVAAVGIERDAEYCEIARARLRQSAFAFDAEAR